MCQGEGRRGGGGKGEGEKGKGRGMRSDWLASTPIQYGGYASRNIREPEENVNNATYQDSRVTSPAS